MFAAEYEPAQLDGRRRSPRAVRVMRATDYEAGCEFIETLEMVDFERLLEVNARRH